ncbi:MAG TPA: hypothetical protein VN853_05720 [Polyangia bacterium]|nr:hypothetical protein [Polyangia bacterium]
MTVAALLLWGCGSSGGGGGTGGEATGGSHTGGSNGSGGAKGGSTGTGGTSATGGAGGQSETGTGGQSATGGAGGQSATGGAGGQSATGGAGGQSATGGAGGQSATGGAGGHPATGGAGGQSATGGAGGQSATGGAGGSASTCPTGTACTATGNVKGICASNVCTTCTNDATGDTACANAYGSGNICVDNACVTGDCHNTNSQCTGGKVCLNNNCSDCTSDTQCGANHLCVGTSCVAGNCRTTGDCGTTSGLVCKSMMCTGCSVDLDCAPYGQFICVSNICTPGDCHSTGDCIANGNTGKVCDLGSHTCTACSSDTQCADPANYNSGHFCQNSACVTGQCRTAGQCSGGQVCNSNLTCSACTSNADCSNTTFGYGPAHVCSGGTCIAGTCTATSDCASAGQLCKGNACVACSTDGDCTGDLFYGSAHICVNNQCVAGTCHDSSTCTGTSQVCNTGTHTCSACGSDSVCQNDASYGPNTICLGNATCVQGNCHDTSGECQNGQICGGAGTAHTCGACADDTACHNDAHYGAGDICFQNGCSPGNCHSTSADCNSTNGDAGEICGAAATNTCGKCTTDTQCQSDTTYGSGTICETASGTTQGACVSALCSTSGACAANGSDFCCGGSCVPGNCCIDTDCGSFGTACVGHTCSACNAVSGNKFFVDPVNGNDSTATGSDMAGTSVAPGCAFKTVARAIQAIPPSPAAGTQIVIVGSSSGPTDLVTSDLVGNAANGIILPANTTLTTTGGAVTITLKTQANKGNASGFVLQNAGSGISGNPSAPLTLNGNSQAAGIAILANPAAGSTNAFNVSNVTVQNTGGVSIRVTAGTLNIGGGVVVKGSASRGLQVSGGVANINNPSGTQTLFTGNLVGIEANTTGSVNVIGTPTSVPSNNGTVLSSFNTDYGLEIDQTPGTTGLALNSINGLVTWGNGAPNVFPGVLLLGGSQVKIRNSVLLSNGTYGVQMSSNGASTSAGSDVSGMDLGTSSDPGHNYLQAPFGGAGVNGSGGLCVAFSNYLPAIGQPATLTETVNAYGNELASSANPSTQVDCSTTAASVTQGTCGALRSIGKNAATNITTNVTFGMCM